MSKPVLDPDDYLSRKEAAKYLSSIGCPLAEGTLANMASNNNRGRGPRFVRIRWQIIRYQRRDLDAWVVANREVVE